MLCKGDLTEPRRPWWSHCKVNLTAACTAGRGSTLGRSSGSRPSTPSSPRARSRASSPTRFPTGSGRARSSRCASPGPRRAAWSWTSTAARPRGSTVVADRAGGGGAPADPRRPRALARRVLRLDPGAHARTRRAARAEAARRATGAAVARRARGRGRAGAADRRAARRDRPHRRRVRERRKLPARGGDRQRQDRGLPPGVRGGARARARRDRAGAGDRADAAGSRPLRGALRRRARDPALGSDRRRAPRRARADRARARRASSSVRGRRSSRRSATSG